MKQYNYDGDRVIDLRQLVLKIWQNATKIILVGLIFAVLFAGIKVAMTFSSVNGDGKYTGIAKIYIANSVPKATANAICDYFTSNSLLDKTIRDLNLLLSLSELSSMINLDGSTNTLINLRVVGTDKNVVQNITDYLTSHGIEQIRNNFKYKSAIIIDPAYTSVNTGIGWANFIKKIARDFIIGFLVGIFLTICIYVFLFIHDTSIRDERDVYYYLGVPVLGVVPAVKGTRKSIDRDKRRKKLRMSQYISDKI